MSFCHFSKLENIYHHTHNIASLKTPHFELLIYGSKSGYDGAA
jgi:hypothetical protein